MDPSYEDYLFLLLVVVVIFAAIKIIIYFIKKHRRHPVVLLMGISNSGKTVLFSKLIYDKVVATYTSMVVNTGMYKSTKNHIKINDIPGNERIRNKLFDDHKTFANGIIFLIDSESIQTELRDVAELLFNVLTDPLIRGYCKEVLIVCNKQDLPLAKGTTVIQMLLEKELNVLRSLKGKQLDATGETGKKRRPYLGSRKKEFEFAHLKPLNVTIAEAITHASADTDLQIDEITQWLEKF